MFIQSVRERRSTAGLLPQDRIELMIETTKEAEDILTQFSAMITTTVGASRMDFTGNEGENITAGEHNLKVQINKL